MSVDMPSTLKIVFSVGLTVEARNVVSLNDVLHPAMFISAVIFANAHSSGNSLSIV